MSAEPLLRSEVADVPCRRGKVRDVYDLGDTLAIVATDRISAFDWVMPNGIPGKGQILTAMTSFWLNWLSVPNHLLSTDLADLPEPFRRRAVRKDERKRHGRTACRGLPGPGCSGGRQAIAAASSSREPIPSFR